MRKPSPPPPSRWDRSSPTDHDARVMPLADLPPPLPLRAISGSVFRNPLGSCAALDGSAIPASLSLNGRPERGGEKLGRLRVSCLLLWTKPDRKRKRKRGKSRHRQLPRRGGECLYFCPVCVCVCWVRREGAGVSCRGAPAPEEEDCWGGQFIR